MSSGPTMPVLTELVGQKRSPKVDKAHLPSSRLGSSSEDLVICGVIGPDHNEIPACPCCNRVNDVEGRQTLNEPTTPSRRDICCAFKLDDDHEDDGDSESEEDDYLPGVLDSGVEYKFRRVLAEGWVSKKGTGNDWLRSRAWKPRWARLVLAKVDGYAVDVPLLMIYWFRSSPNPSTVILLDSTVVVPVDKNDDQCTPFRLSVIHVKDGDSSECVKRTFSVPKKGRDQWVYAINSALLKYEKDNAQARREAAALSALRPRSSLSEAVMDAKHYRRPSDSAGGAVSPPPPPPPLSPRSSHPRVPLSPKKPLPRSDQLLGEWLVD